MDAATLLGIPAGTEEGVRRDMRDLVLVLTAAGLAIDEASRIIEAVAGRRLRAMDASNPRLAEVLLDFTREVVRDAVRNYHDLADANEL